MSTLTGRLALKDVIEQGWKQLQSGFLNQLRQTIEGLLGTPTLPRGPALR
jgi:hypothetical protein